jgi:hypothetical protein
LKDGRDRPVTLLIDLSEVIDGDLGIAINGETGALPLLYESTELESDRLSTSSEPPSSTDRMLGEPPSDLNDGGAARVEVPRGRMGNEKEGVGEFWVARAASVSTLCEASLDALSSDSGDCDRGKGK